MLRNFLFFIVMIIPFIHEIAVSAEIIETNEISTVQDYVTKDSLLFFDVTGTLYEPATTLANHDWRVYFSERVHSIVSDADLAESFINKIKNQIVNHIPKKPVEEQTSRLISSLQDQQIPVFGITCKQIITPYADNFGLITRNHLLSVGVNLQNTLSYVHVKESREDASHSFVYGILFTNKKPVGPAILAFLDCLPHLPAKIIMIDDSLNNLKNAEEMLVFRGVKFEGLRYGRSDILKTNFDPILGNIQFFAFINNQQILSDEQALRIKQEHPETDFSLMLDDYIREQMNLKSE